MTKEILKMTKEVVRERKYSVDEKESTYLEELDRYYDYRESCNDVIFQFVGTGRNYNYDDACFY